MDYLARCGSCANIRHTDLYLLARLCSANEDYESFDSGNTLASFATVDDSDLVLFAGFDRLATSFSSLLSFLITSASAGLVTCGTSIAIEATALTVPVSITQNCLKTLQRLRIRT